MGRRRIHQEAVRVHVVMDRTVREALERRAEREGRTLSQVACRAIEAWLRWAGELPLAAEPRQEKAR